MNRRFKSPLWIIPWLRQLRTPFLASVNVDIEADDSVTADEITIETGVATDVEVVAAPDDEGEIPAPTDTDEEEVVEAPA